MRTWVQWFGSDQKFCTPLPWCACMRKRHLAYIWLHLMDKKILIYHRRVYILFHVGLKAFLWNSTKIEWTFSINISLSQTLIWMYEHIILINLQSRTQFHIDPIFLQSEAHSYVFSKLLPFCRHIPTSLAMHIDCNYLFWFVLRLEHQIGIAGN